VLLSKPLILIVEIKSVMQGNIMMSVMAPFFPSSMMKVSITMLRIMTLTITIKIGHSVHDPYTVCHYAECHGTFLAKQKYESQHNDTQNNDATIKVLIHHSVLILLLFVIILNGMGPILLSRIMTISITIFIMMTLSITIKNFHLLLDSYAVCH
jgi:hypothetical protein